MKKSVSQVQRAHQWVAQYLGDGDIAIDATVGNGYDTCFLAQQVGADGYVYGFDIQQSALDLCYQRLVEQNLQSRVGLINSCHTDMRHIPRRGEIGAIIFNLGYLPGGDKQISTKSESTLKALEASLVLVHKNGVISIVAYPGHTAGKQETTVVKQWVRSLPPDQYQVNIEIPDNVKNPAPELFVIIKR